MRKHLFLLLMSGGLIFCGNTLADGYENVAKTAVSTQHYAQNPATFAVDNDENTCFKGRDVNGCELVINTGQSYQISYIEIIFGAPTTNYIVELANDESFLDSKIYASITETSTEKRIYIPDEYSYKYVKIKKQDAIELNVCEVFVMVATVNKKKVEMEASPDNEVTTLDESKNSPNAHLTGRIVGGTNIAISKPVFASSVYEADKVNFAAAKAVDGKKSTGWSQGEGSYAWITVDLLKPYKLSGVMLYSREDLDQPYTRRNFRVVGANKQDFSDSVVLGFQGAVPYYSASPWVLEINESSLYRYIKIEKTDDEYFFIAEIEIYSGGKYVESPEISQIATPSISEKYIQPIIMTLCAREPKTAVLKVFSNVALQEGQISTLSITDKFLMPQRYEGQIYIPLRYLADFTGSKAKYDKEMQTVELEYENNKVVVVGQNDVIFLDDKIFVPCSFVNQFGLTVLNLTEDIFIISKKKDIIDNSKDSLIINRITNFWR